MDERQMFFVLIVRLEVDSPMPDRRKRSHAEPIEFANLIVEHRVTVDASSFRIEAHSSTHVLG